MISKIVYVCCLILISAAYILSYASAHKRLRREYDARCEQIQDNHERRREDWIRCIDNLKAQRSDLKIMIERKNDIITELEGKLLCVPTWRLSSVELPEANDRVLICSVTKKGEKRINIAWYEDGKWHGNGNLDNVTAWMRLPELPGFEDPAEVE